MFNLFKLFFTDKNKYINLVKDNYITEMVAIHTQAKIQVAASKKTVRMIENSTAFKIAKATGRLNV
jgi:hypothetical protein